MEVVSMSPRDLAAKKQGGEAVELIDVRTPVEFSELHCVFARNVPLSDLDPKAVMTARTGGVDVQLYVICRSGSRGKRRAGSRVHSDPASDSKSARSDSQTSLQSFSTNGSSSL